MSVQPMIMKYFLLVGTGDILGTWMGQKNIILSEVTQKERDRSE